MVTTLSSMTAFTETSSQLVYYRGQFQFSFPVSSRAGNVTYYVQGTPGYKRTGVNQTLFIGESYFFFIIILFVYLELAQGNLEFSRCSTLFPGVLQPCGVNCLYNS